MLEQWQFALGVIGLMATIIGVLLTALARSHQSNVARASKIATMQSEMKAFAEWREIMNGTREKVAAIMEHCKAVDGRLDEMSKRIDTKADASLCQLKHGQINRE